MEEVMQVIQSNLLEILNTILVAVAAYVGVQIKAAYQKYVNDKTKKEIVGATVKYVEQICKSLDVKKTSQEKFEDAKNKSLEWLNEKGIKISDTELEILIESAVNSFNESIKGD